jgi:prepilin-type N-terminal cleavage/methylation domain-containing protein
MISNALTRRRRLERGFTLIEMIVVVFLLAIAMLGILAVFDASARINKSEQDVADAQGNVRFGIYQMTRAIRMAGAGPIFVAQSVLNAPDTDLPGIVVGSGTGYDNVTGATVTDLSGTAIPVRDGTDMIEVRGVINSPLLSLDAGSGCTTCIGTEAVTAKPITFGWKYPHVNDDVTNRPQFAQIDAYTQGVSAGNPMLVLVTGKDDIHTACSTIDPTAHPTVTPRYPQPTYNVGLLTAPTSLVASQTFGNVNFSSGVALEFTTELPSLTGAAPTNMSGIGLREGGVLDDLVYFIDNSDPTHPSLAQGTRRGNNFDVIRLADDVEDMQIAYGVDTDGNGAINRLVPTVAATDTDANVSTQAGGDEWRPNAAGEAVYTAGEFQMMQPAPAIFTHPGCHGPRLHGVMVSLVAKSKDPDPTYRAPNSRGVVTMNTPVTVAPPYPDVAQYPTISTEPQYRRRVQTLKINLRNNSFQQ